MNTAERHRLKDNEIAQGLAAAGDVWERNSKTIAQAVGVVVVVAIAAGGYWWYQREHAPAAPASPPPVAVAPPVEVPPPAAPQPPAVQYPRDAASAAQNGEPFVLPPPDKADPLIEKLLAELVGRKALLSMLQVDRFATRVVATVDNLPRKHVSVRLWPVHPTPGRMVVEQRGDTATVAPGNAERYAPLIQMIESVDTARAASLYVKLYPLFQQAYEDLGYPGRYFNDRLVDAIDDLLAAPPTVGPVRVQLREVSGPIKPARPWVMYEAVDPALENRSAGQKILLRVGNANAERLKTKLREFRRYITAGATQQR
jgi:hypothetical protein